MKNDITEEFLQDSSVLYPLLNKAEKLIMQLVIEYHFYKGCKTDPAEVVKALCKILAWASSTKEDLLLLVKYAPYLTPVAFLQKPARRTKVAEEVQYIIEQLLMDEGVL